MKGDFSEQLKKVIAKCLKTNPWERPTAEQLERYAETALNGGRIQFLDEKPFFQKYKYYAFAATFTIIVGCIAIGYWLNENKEKEKEFALQAKIAYVNDSIIKQISANEEMIHQQMTIGDQHEEGYELAYIKAYDELLIAISSADKLTDGFRKDKIGIFENIKDSLEYKLYLAYSSFIEKSTLFENDDPEVSDEFRKRATNISNRIDVNKFHVANSDEIRDDSIN